MKKIVYLSAIFMFSFSLLSVANTKKESVDNNKEIVETVEIEKIQEKSENGEAFFAWYRGRCLDGTTFRFWAENAEEAQGYVNGYCDRKDEEAGQE